MTTIHLNNGTEVQARPGQFVRCDCFGRFLRVVDHLSNGLGLTYKVEAGGTLSRVIF